MSLSTTTTTTYDLTKYSRAYNQATPEQGELQWQHFVNPVIRLTMDTRKAFDGHLESYRLKITWMFSAGLDSMDVDQREVVFEDLDLVSYSSMPSLQAPQGMPLKAVYQEAVVGIRYQHPRVAPHGTTPQYRRFQVVFDSASSASTFIESIRFICPCKANAPPPPRGIQRASTTLGGPGVQGSSQMSAPSPVRPPAGSSLRQSATMVPAPEHDPPPGIRRTGTTLPSFSTLTKSTSNWDAPPPTPYATQAPLARSTSISPAYSSGSGFASSRDDAYSSSRPSSAVAHRSSSSSSGPSSGAAPASAPTAVYAAAPVPTAAYPQSSAHVAVSISAPASAPVPDYAPTPATPAASAIAQSSTIARPPQIQPSATALAHSGSSDTSLPSSSFPHSSSSPPPMPRLRPSSPDLMPPPPVPTAVSRAPTLAEPPAGTQTVAPSHVAGSSASAVATMQAPPEAVTETVSTALPEAAREPSGTALSRNTIPVADITASLRDSGGLYALPKEELEKLVAEVIREEGFANLMTALDGMWKVKGLVGIS